MINKGCHVKDISRIWLQTTTWYQRRNLQGDKADIGTIEINQFNKKK